jgi:hypothetical protein
MCGDRNMSFWSVVPTDKMVNSLRDDFGDVEGLNGLLDDILGLVDSSFYGDLVSFYGVPKDSRVDSGDFDVPSELVRLASRNMSKFPFALPFTPLITGKLVLLVPSFVYDLCGARLGRNFSDEELKKIFYGDLPTRILLLMENFDSTMETPEPTSDFFKKLGKVKWADSMSKDLFNRVTDLEFKVMYRKLESKYSISLSVNEKAFILLLSGCSAVSDGRDKITMDDVVRAYKMYFKLLNTDITRLM